MIPDFVFTILWIIGYVVTAVIMLEIIYHLGPQILLSPADKENSLTYKVSVLKAQNLFNSCVYKKIDRSTYVFTRSDKSCFTFFNRHGYSLEELGWTITENAKYINYDDHFMRTFQKLLAADENTKLSQQIKENHRLKMLSLQAELNQAKLDAMNIKRNDFSETFEKSQWYLAKGKAIDDLRKEILEGPP